MLTVDSLLSDESNSYKEAIQIVKRDQQKWATKEEMISVKKNDTWELINKPRDKKIISCKSLYKKDGIPGVEEPWFKGRLIGMGFT